MTPTLYKNKNLSIAYIREDNKNILHQMHFNTITILLLLTLINQSSPNQSSDERPMRLEKSSSFKSNLSTDFLSTKCKEKLKGNYFVNCYCTFLHPFG